MKAPVPMVSHQGRSISVNRPTLWSCWPRSLALGWCLCAMGVAAQSNPFAGLFGAGALEITYGLNQSNLSLWRGVVIDTKLEPTLDFKLETNRGFVSLQNGVGFWLSHSAALKSGVSLNYMLGRHQSTDVHYQGLGDKSGSVDVYAFAEWQPILDAVTLYANAASTPAPMQREFLQAGVTLGIPMFNLWNAFVDFNQTWGNAPYWQTYYGVSAQQQATSMKAVFMPTSGGALYQSKTLGGVYSVNKSTDLILGLGALEASQSLMQSPVMGARVQHTGVIMINQKFVSH